LDEFDCFKNSIGESSAFPQGFFQTGNVPVSPKTESILTISYSFIRDALRRAQAVRWERGLLLLLSPDGPIRWYNEL
jgi:hypothetical protein